MQVDPEDLQLMREKALYNYSSLSYYRVEKKLVTTAVSTLVFDSSFSFLITCYPNKIAIGDWKRQQRAYDARSKDRVDNRFTKNTDFFAIPTDTHYFKITYSSTYAMLCRQCLRFILFFVTTP